MASEENNTTVVDELDDIDDDLLDEVLDDFSSQQSSKQPESSNQPTTSTSTSKDLLSDNITDDEYAAQLAADMEDFVKQFEDEEIKQVFKDMMNSIGDEPEIGVGNDNNNFGGANEFKEKSFQDKINQTMNKLQNSSDQVDAEISEGAADAIGELEQMIKQLGEAGLAGLGENGDMEDMMGGGMDKVLEWMMETLATKDYLYEPMKEFSQKYPKWLEENKSKVSEEDYKRYEKQSEYIQKIIEKYEAPDFDEKSEQQNKAIVSLMQELQDLGQPPTEILSELAQVAEQYI